MAARRIDLALVELGYFLTREKAQRAIMAGLVYLDTELITKAARLIKPADEPLIRVRQKDHAVSRAYYKLQKALDCFAVEVDSRPLLDVGSSTGGFTQLVLERGADYVWAVDCGTNQLAWSLRSDPRVIVMEKTNARYLTRSALVEAFSEQVGFEPVRVPNLAVMDVSFISLGLLLPVLVRELGISELVTLIKPQFEAGRDEVGAGGIVRKSETHRSVLKRVIAGAADLGLGLAGLTWSPLTGSEGNIEFLAHYLAGQPGPDDPTCLINEVVSEAHRMLVSPVEKG